MLISLGIVPIVPLGTQNRLFLTAVPEPVLLFGKFLRATACSKHDTNLPLLLERKILWPQTGVTESFGRCSQAKRHHPGDMFALSRLDPCQFVELRYFAGDVYRKMSAVKAGDAFHAGFPSQYRAAESLLANSIRADHAHAGNDYSREHFFCPSQPCRCGRCRSGIIIQMPLGLYISVPFCRTKCSYCNFASGVTSRNIFDSYVLRLCAEINQSRETADHVGGINTGQIDSIYFGGGTPTLLDVAQLKMVFVTIRQNFDVMAGAEITVECAPGTLSPPVLDMLANCGVNRISLGVQSFVEIESASVGRLHKRATVIDDVMRLRSSGIQNINVDLIAGLPHQNRASWEQSLDDLISLATPHASIYMLEVDEDSRLGRELLAGGSRYHAHFVPDDDLTTDMYELACDRLNAAGLEQYEISNFARPARASKHNLKYWTRQPYLGFGVDAHSMLPSRAGGAVRFSNPDVLEKYISGAPKEQTFVSRERALEEAFFLRLRLARGVDWESLAEEFGGGALSVYGERIKELCGQGLLAEHAGAIQLTRRGRLLSNEVFEQFISPSLATS
jgi:oxygen-independent coproporphyrinogen-3 oxidase